MWKSPADSTRNETPAEFCIGDIVRTLLEQLWRDKELKQSCPELGAVVTPRRRPQDSCARWRFYGQLCGELDLSAY